MGRLVMMRVIVWYAGAMRDVRCAAPVHYISEPQSMLGMPTEEARWCSADGVTPLRLVTHQSWPVDWWSCEFTWDACSLKLSF